MIYRHFQVHEAWLDGKRYAVKVQRPGLKSLFGVDLKSIGALAAVLDRFDPKLDGASRCCLLLLFLLALALLLVLLVLVFLPVVLLRLLLL